MKYQNTIIHVIEDGCNDEFLIQIGYDENEPPLNDDEIEGLKIARQESLEGNTIPLSEVLKVL